MGSLRNWIRKLSVEIIVVVTVTVIVIVIVIAVAIRVTVTAVVVEVTAVVVVTVIVIVIHPPLPAQVMKGEENVGVNIVKGDLPRVHCLLPNQNQDLVQDPQQSVDKKEKEKGKEKEKEK